MHPYQRPWRSALSIVTIGCITVAYIVQFTPLLTPVQLLRIFVIVWAMISIDNGWDLWDEISTIRFIKTQHLEQQYEEQYKHHWNLARILSGMVLTGIIVTLVDGGILIGKISDNLIVVGWIAYFVFIILIFVIMGENIRYRTLRR